MIDFILRPLRRNFGKDKMFYRAIDDMFGFVPHNIELYKLALIHKSASIVLENGQHINNERLEFLGDAIIESVSSDYLFIEFPDKNEGFLTQLRSKMVSRQTLNSVAKRIGLDEHVITNSSSSSSQKHIYGDAFEAMMGAIYLDQGYDFVNRLLINKIFTKYLKLETLAESETDFKSRLIEWCQKNHHSIDFVTTHDKTYSSTHPFFYSKVMIDNIEMGHGAGESKKEAEQRAAFSVSQGFNDADCTKLLDRLDDFDANTKTEQKTAEKPAPKKESKPRIEKPKAEPKSEDKSLTESKVEEIKPEPIKVETEAKTEEAKPKAEEPKAEQKPKPKRAPRPKKSAPTEESAANESATSNNTTNEVTASESPATEAPATNAPARKSRRAPKKEAKAAEKPSTNEVKANEKTTVAEAKTEQEAAENKTENSPENKAKSDSAPSENKPRPRRRRPAKDKAQTAVTEKPQE